jgi:hypothetical protein
MLRTHVVISSVNILIPLTSQTSLAQCPPVIPYGYIPIRPYKIEIQITTGDESAALSSAEAIGIGLHEVSIGIGLHTPQSKLHVRFM